MQNHTATHLANWALREVLGEGVQQKGSLVDPEKLRFDFSHGKAMSDEEIERVEKLVNESVGKKLAVYAEVVPQEKALKIEGLRAVFGEKYPPMVRVVSVGAPVGNLIANPADPKWRQFSVEFCGGTHIGNSAEVKQFVITAEESVSKGIRQYRGCPRPAAASARGERGSKAVTESLEGNELPRVSSFAGSGGAAGDRTLQKEAGVKECCAALCGKRMRLLSCSRRSKLGRKRSGNHWVGATRMCWRLPIACCNRPPILRAAS